MPSLLPGHYAAVKVRKELYVTFRTLKSECLRTAEYSTPAELERLISGFVSYYNDKRIHQSLGYETPSSWYFTGINTKAA